MMGKDNLCSPVDGMVSAILQTTYHMPKKKRLKTLKDLESLIGVKRWEFTSFPHAADLH